MSTWSVDRQPNDRRVPGEGGNCGWLRVLRVMRTALAAGLLGLLGMIPANAAVNLRVEARPVSDPIKAYVTVTGADGRPASGLASTDFAVLVDGVAVASPSFAQPASQDPEQRVSVVFVMDFSTSVTDIAMSALQESIVDFINAMKPGDWAAVVKFNATNPSKASVVQGFTQIDGGAGSSALVSAVMAPYPGNVSGNQTNLFDAIYLAAEQFRAPSPPLPPGPKAIVVASDGDDNASTRTGNEAVNLANQFGVSIFTIGVGTVETGRPLDILNELANRSGGQYISGTSDAQIADAYVKIATLLNNEYVLSFTSSITDCRPHTLEVRVTGQPATSTTFTRCTEAPPPPPSGDGGGGGGGSTGLLEFIAGMALLGLRRRRRAA